MNNPNPHQIFTLDREAVISIHDKVLYSTGGLLGVNTDILEGALSRIDYRVNYQELSDPIEIAAWYGYAIARAHAFTDGNKRTALVCMDVYLLVVGVRVDLSQPIPEDLANLMEDVAEGRLTEQELVRWLRDNEDK